MANDDTAVKAQQEDLVGSVSYLKAFAEHVPCPICREPIIQGAKVCKHCKCVIDPFDDPTRKVSCPACGERIRARAKVCIVCKSDLTWKRFLPVGSTTLAMTTALVAVVATVAPGLKRLAETDSPRLDAQFLSEINDSREISVLAINDGSRLGPISEVMLTVRWKSANTDGIYVHGFLPSGRPTTPYLIEPHAAVAFRFEPRPQGSDIKGAAGDFKSALNGSASMTCTLFLRGEFLPEGESPPLPKEHRISCAGVTNVLNHLLR